MKSKHTIVLLLLLQYYTYYIYAFVSTAFTNRPISLSSQMVALPITSEEPGNLLKHRLIEGGIVTSSNIKICTEYESSSDRSSSVHVKTLVWEVSYNEETFVDDGGSNTVLYIVTAQKMTDRVDISLLQECIYNDQQLSSKHLLPEHPSHISISMAPTEKAEQLTGFKSGCMPPIGHTIPMKLYVEQSIVEYDIASIGSGTLGHSLELPMKQLLNVAESNKHGVIVEKFIQSSRSESPSSVIIPQTNNYKERKEIRRRASEPKDRLKQYRSLTSIEDKAQLLRTTFRKKGRVDASKQLIDEAIRVNEFQSLMLTYGTVGVNKNALHLCSWKGDFEAVKYIVEMSKKHYPEMDIINTISKSEGNYGKTPIFYALTQCREDVVRYLIVEGASLLIVNNKGQTPCSIAVSHLNEDACQFLFDVEAEQLRNGGEFVNYRTTHSDSKLYGDLDPRFDIDSNNMGDDISEQLEEYRESIENGCHQDIPTSFSPRSLRPTVRWWKREDRSLENANKEGAGQLTFTQSRVSHPKKVKADEQQQSPHKKSLPISDAPKKVQLDIDSLDPLTTEEVLKPQSTTDEIKIMVDSSESIRVLELEIDHTIHHAKTLAESVDYSVDEVVLESVWGLDAEWKPGKNCGSDNPVSTLQLSTQRCSFLIDLQSLCQSLHLEDSCDESAQSETELELNRILSKLFQESNIPIIGFGVLADLGKMAASFPHMPCFSLYNGVIDLQIVSSIVLPKPDAQFASSLQKTVALVLQRRLLKKQQCFDWTTRPLSSEQIEYATLDAAVLPYLLKQIMGDNVLERYNGQLFNEYPHLISNIRFTFLQDTSEPTGSERVLWEIPMGKVTSLFSKQLARQCWPASSPSISDFPTKRVLPAEPLKPTLTKKERAHLRKVGTGKRPKPVQLKDLTGKLDDLPKVGTVMGYTKDTCVHRVLGHEFIKARPERTHIGFNRRSGVSELTNCYVLFCNFGGVYRSSSGFLKEGREFRFNLKSNDKAAKSSEKSLYDFFSSWRQEVFDKKILLFARGSTKHKYLYCGECKYKGVFPTEDESMDLHLNLINYSEVVSKDDSEEFFELIRIGAAEYPSI